MVTAMPETTKMNGNNVVDLPAGMDISLKIEAEAIAEFDRLQQLVDEIRQTRNDIPQCEEYLKMISGQPYASKPHAIEHRRKKKGE
jgi:hypothetical protein